MKFTHDNAHISIVYQISSKSAKGFKRYVEVQLGT